MEEERYARHLVLPEIGQKGQKTLKESSVAIFGLGALGATITDTLARTGIGHLKLIDRDFVEISNMNHQILYDEKDIGKSKAEVAEERVREINSDVEVESIVTNIDSGNIEKLIEDVDLVMDGSDNLELRYLTNDACVKKEIPWIYSAVLGTYGMNKPILPERNACLRCFFPEKPSAGSLETCETAGVLFTLPRLIANISSTEAVRLLLGEEVREELLTIDVWTTDFELTKIERRKESCETCSKKEYKFLEREEDTVTELCGRDSIQISPAEDQELNLEDLGKRFEKGDMMGDRMLKVELDQYELNIFEDGRAIIKGTDDPKKAQSLYSQYIGK